MCLLDGSEPVGAHYIISPRWIEASRWRFAQIRLIRVEDLTGTSPSVVSALDQIRTGTFEELAAAGLDTSRRDVEP